MIHPDCKYLDIYPYTWRHLGAVMEYLIPQKKILYILHSQGNIKRAAASDNQVYDLPFTTYNGWDFPKESLFSEYDEIDEIHVLDETSLIHYYTAVQRVSLDEKNSMEYLDFITDYYTHHKGIDVYTKKTVQPSFYRKCLDYGLKHLRGRKVILFTVMKQDYIWFDVVLLAENGTITEVRTLDTLKDDSWYKTPAPRLDAAQSLLADLFHCQATLITLTYEQLSSLTDFWETYRIEEFTKEDIL